MSIVTDYFNYLDKYKKEYGENTVILMQIGSFYELYGIDNSKEKLGNVVDITQLLNIQLTRKNKNIPEINRKNPLMAGIPCCSLEKYLPVLVNNNYTVVLIDQFVESGKITRKVKNIYSAGTVLNVDTTDTNYISSLYIEDIKGKLLAGITSIDLTIGDNNIFEVFGEKTDVFDKIAFFIKAFRPSEIIINLKNTEYTKEHICNLLELENALVHFNTTKIDQSVYSCNYQNLYLSKVFTNNKTYLSTLEYLDIETKAYAVISLIILIGFVYSHNEFVLLNLKNPVVYDPGEFLSVLNNGFYQLDMFSDNKKGKYKCVFDVINNTKTVLGKRKLKNDILFPIKSITELNNRYDKIDSVSKLNQTELTAVTDLLKTIRDLQRLHQRISLGVLRYDEWIDIINANNALIKIQQILTDKVNVPTPIKEINTFLDKYSKIFNYEEQSSFIRTGINNDLDTMSTEISTTKKILQDLAQKYSNIIGITDSVKVNYSEKDLYFLSTTNIRSNILKKELTNLNYLSNKSGTKITSKEINMCSNKLISNETKFNSLIKEVYQQILKDTHLEYYTLFKKVEQVIAEIDVIVSAYIVSKENHYTRPVLMETPHSYIKVTDIRHPLIEKINTGTQYITNDIDLNNKSMILYGVNSSGKTSIIKSVGISIILAQAGLYVPCSNMELSPFNTVVTRINGSDSILKGHSSFVVEILELKMILKNANKNTIILADELCNSTEQVSASAIVASTILSLHKMDCSFILVSHISWLSKFDKIKELKNVIIKHISVLINGENITFDRKLYDGPGPDIYGLEIAKSLQLDHDFIETAYNIRNELTNKAQTVCSSKKSVYNKNKIVDQCEICGYVCTKKTDIPLDVHHINFQCTADVDGVIHTQNASFNKNELHNLVTLCKTCHQDVHKNKIIINGYTFTNSGKKLQVLSI